MRRYVLGDGQSEYMFINWKGFMISIFYVLSVVGDNTYFMDTKMGGRTHSAAPLLRVCGWIQLENLSAWVILSMIFLGRYCKDTTLLLGL